MKFWLSKCTFKWCFGKLTLIRSKELKKHIREIIVQNKINISVFPYVYNFLWRYPTIYRNALFRTGPLKISLPTKINLKHFSAKCHVRLPPHLTKFVTTRMEQISKKYIALLNWEMPSMEEKSSSPRRSKYLEMHSSRKLNDTMYLLLTP